MVSAGNAPNPIEVDRVVDADALEIEYPAQAWNALTVGGYTDRINIQEPEFAGFSPCARAGALSPYSRTSTLWVYARAAEIVGVDRTACVLVANHAFDCVGAKACGMRTVFIDRRRRPFGETPHRPDLIVDDMRALAAALA